MKKNILIILTIGLIVLVVAVYGIFSYREKERNAKQVNKVYESYYQKEVLGTDVATLINKATDSNEKNGVEKDNSKNYIDNEENSIKIEVKFVEADKAISMESIQKQDIHQFIQNFSTHQFKIGRAHV